MNISTWEDLEKARAEWEDMRPQQMGESFYITLSRGGLGGIRRTIQAKTKRSIYLRALREYPVQDSQTDS